MTLNFTKMHGAGNDFVVFDAVRQRVALSGAQLRRIADRHFGIGCDQILLVEPPTQAGVDFRYRIFNADGGEVEQCGNGARCFVRFVREQGLTDKTEIAVETLAGVIYPRLEADGNVSVNMGRPNFNPAEVPFTGAGEGLVYTLPVAGEAVELRVVSMGNPHAVRWVADAAAAPVATQGPAIERHAAFPRRVNVSFAQRLDAHRVRLRVWERGAGETLACGTAACAVVAVGVREGLLAGDVAIELPGGVLRARWAAEGTPVWLSGPATTVFHGSLDPANL